jgi:ketosteroid isomerase-like protein
MSKQVIDQFYTAFQKKDWKSMQALYHDDATFSDPAFQNLTSKEVKAMWHMLLTASKDLELTFTNVSGDDNKGSCRWDAFYSFSRTGRKVHNIITANFVFKQGKIVSHLDHFDLWKWSGMALGWPGKLLGWSPLIKNKIRDMARKNLMKFISEHPEYQ